MGLRDSEFWLSTYAKIRALEDIQEIQDKRRDFFSAYLIAIELNKHRATDSKVYTAQDVLAFQYRNKQQSVNFTQAEDGADMGAECDWKSTRAWLKGR